MNYYFDTEFVEGTQKGLFGTKTKPTIDLISIGVVAQDGREFYAISKDFNLREAWNRHDLVINKQFPCGGEYRKVYWIRENVLKSIWKELVEKEKAAACKFNKMGLGHMEVGSLPFTYSVLKKLLKKYGKTNEDIATEIVAFVNHNISNVVSSITRADCWNEKYYPKEFKYIESHNTFIPDQIYSSGTDGKGAQRNEEFIYNQPKFYAYYADYDWVVFCWLFGKMKDLPNGFPMYCNDLKQMMDEKGLDKDWKKKNCPDPKNAHNALSDALWNVKLHSEILKK